MTKEEFERRFERVTDRNMEALSIFLRCDPKATADEQNQQIAKAMGIEPSSIGGYIRNIYNQMLGPKEKGTPRNPDSRQHLRNLFKKYRPNLVGNGNQEQGEASEPSGGGEITLLDTLDDMEFVGRQEAIAALNQLKDGGAKIILVLAPGGIGKTELARRWLEQTFGGEENILDFELAKVANDLAAAESWVQEQVKELGGEPGQDYGVMLSRLRTLLSQEPKGIFIDNLETALDPRTGQFLQEHRAYELLLRTLTHSQVQSVTVLTSRQNLTENFRKFEVYRLKALTEKDWRYFFEQKGIEVDTNGNEADPSVLTEIHQFFGGNAFVMNTLVSPIRDVGDGSLAEYWDCSCLGESKGIEPNIQGFVKELFDQLSQCPDAYNLLCRMGCFRYQDVPQVPQDALLALLWDVDESQRLLAVRELQNRRLIQWQRKEFWIHPFIKEEGVLRLRASGQWKEANRRAAVFWTEYVEKVETVDDARKAMEAYYHHKSANDSEATGYALSHRRGHQWVGNESLGRSLYRLGLVEEAISCIDTVVEEISNQEIRYSLYNLLGDIYWTKGDLYTAIKNHNLSLDLSKEAEDIIYYHKSLFNLGLCYLDLGELSRSMQYMLRAKKLLDDEEMEPGAAVFSYLSFLSILTERDTLSSQQYINFAVKIFDQFRTKDEKLWSYIQDRDSQIWAYGYANLVLGMTYLGMSKLDDAIKYCELAISFSVKTGFSQLYGKALYIKATISRECSQLDRSITTCLEAIQILSEVGAKCDLAEAYFQCGLTYLKMGDLEEAHKFRDQAIEIFEAIPAPKQIARIRQTFEEESGK